MPREQLLAPISPQNQWLCSTTLPDHQPSSTIINHHLQINHHQPSTIKILRSQTIINYQPSAIICNWSSTGVEGSVFPGGQEAGAASPMVTFCHDAMLGLDTQQSSNCEAPLRLLVVAAFGITAYKYCNSCQNIVTRIVIADPTALLLHPPLASPAKGLRQAIGQDVPAGTWQSSLFLSHLDVHTSYSK